MTYPLQSRSTLLGNYVFWLGKFFIHKITTLSNRHIHDSSTLSKSLDSIRDATNLDDLTESIKQARNSGMTGINTYALPLLRLGRFLQESRVRDLEEIDEVFLAEFITLSTARLSNATKRNYRIALIGFFGFIDKHNEDEAGKSYIFNIELKNLAGTRGKSGVKLPTFLKTDELEQFLHSIDTTPLPAKTQARDRLIVKFIIYTGIRVSEAINLQAQKVIQENDVYMLTIQGKGDKYRVVMIKSSHITQLLHSWLTLREEIPNIQNNLLFCNKNGKPLSQPYVYGIVRKILLNIGIKKEKMGAHMLRHSFATLLYQKHKDLVLVQEALGHADLNTSRIYTHFDKDRLIKAADLMDSLH
ncbi:tyrosine-type recombinase/integrase [Helicobacter canis]|uniref:Tyr recombinase domain-containing protein n=1 Tax=Helicobacter canis NCTC 12740 TaxID=1357399 RepID=V8CK43_9HELI|nr:tyrosine-type recombinase/integrase [Helicobacter canis]ETD27116.1 hypothetical protein HMPREF2087_00024 [Helicobacter canis NCTC 12740]